MASKTTALEATEPKWQLRNKNRNCSNKKSHHHSLQGPIVRPKLSQQYWKVNCGLEYTCQSSKSATISHSIPMGPCGKCSKIPQNQAKCCLDGLCTVWSICGLLTQINGARQIAAPPSDLVYRYVGWAQTRSLWGWAYVYACAAASSTLSW